MRKVSLSYEVRYTLLVRRIGTCTCNVIDLVVNFVCFCEITFVAFYIAMCNPVQDIKTLHGLC